MTTASRKDRTNSFAQDLPSFLFHPSFEEADAEQEYGSIPTQDGLALGFLSDDATRASTKRMHYAAWRASQAENRRERERWRRRYLDCRDHIVLGNRKLTFRAVQKWNPPAQYADDMAGECQIVLIKAVAAFNPWLGIRFSTYAFTCLMRALSRLSQRQAADRLARSLSIDSLPSCEPTYAMPEDPSWPNLARLGEYFQDEHTLLTAREKSVLIQRYHLHDNVPRMETLEQVGRELGLSKEWVRQIQSTAVGKLRAALVTEASES